MSYALPGLFAAMVLLPPPQYFQYERATISMPAQARQVCLTLPADLFARAASGLADLRVYHNGSETPYAIRQFRVATPARIVLPLNLGTSSSAVAFDAAMPEEQYGDVTLDIAARDFIGTVTVSGSQTATGVNPTKLGSFTIFDLTRQKLGRSTILHLPETNFRYLHFRVAGPISLDSFTSISVEPAGSQLSYITVAQTPKASEKGTATIAEFTVPAHVPVDRVRIIPGRTPVNFARDATISVGFAGGNRTDEPSQAVEDKTGSFLRLHRLEEGHQIDEEALAIEVDRLIPTAPTRWRVTIENGNDAPLPIESVVLEMAGQQLCFDSAGTGAYTLFYGDPGLQAPHYDYAQLFRADPDAGLVTLAAEQPNPEYKPRPDQRAFPEKHPRVLWGALIAVVMLLGGLAWRTARSEM